MEAIGAEGKVLASGVDSLVLSLSLNWKNDDFFKLLNRLKADAAAQNAPMPGVIEAGPDTWIFNVRPRGTEGYAWLLNSGEYDIRLIQRMQAGARPSAMVEIRSPTLWRTGAIEAVDRILALLAAQGAIVEKAMVSRADLCLDILLPESIWTPDLEYHAVKQADFFVTFRDGSLLSGFRVGSGNLQARLYDKPLEIRTKSKKTWMYDVWGLEEVPAGGRVIRVEFQIRREVLTELGIDTVWQLLNYPRNLWAYCAQNWLKFQNDAKLHHTQQSTMPWWRTVQDNFLGGQRACPLIRAKIVNANKRQMSQQLLGQLTSLVALDSEGDITPGGTVEQIVQLSKVIESAELIGMDEHKFHERVRRKIAKYVQAVSKFKAAEQERKALGFPLMDKRHDSNGGAK